MNIEINNSPDCLGNPRDDLPAILKKLNFLKAQFSDEYESLNQYLSHFNDDSNSCETDAIYFNSFSEFFLKSITTIEEIKSDYEEIKTNIENELVMSGIFQYLLSDEDESEEYIPLIKEMSKNEDFKSLLKFIASDTYSELTDSIEFSISFLQDSALNCIRAAKEIKEDLRKWRNNESEIDGIIIDRSYSNFKIRITGSKFCPDEFNFDVFDSDESNQDESDSDNFDSDESDSDDFDLDESDLDDFDSDEFDSDESDSDDFDLDESDSDESDSDNFDLDESDSDDFDSDNFASDEFDSDDSDSSEFNFDESEDEFDFDVHNFPVALDEKVEFLYSMKNNLAHCVLIARTDFQNLYESKRLAEYRKIASIDDSSSDFRKCVFGFGPEMFRKELFGKRSKFPDFKTDEEFRHRLVVLHERFERLSPEKKKKLVKKAQRVASDRYTKVLLKIEEYICIFTGFKMKYKQILIGIHKLNRIKELVQTDFN